MQKENDILYVQVVDRNIVIHTLEDAHIGSLNDQLELLLGYFGFAKADQNKYVQVSKISTRDKKERKLYFNPERTKFCSVTRPNIKHFFW